LKRDLVATYSKCAVSFTGTDLFPPGLARLPVGGGNAGELLKEAYRHLLALWAPTYWPHAEWPTSVGGNASELIGKGFTASFSFMGTDLLAPRRVAGLTLFVGF